MRHLNTKRIIGMLLAAPLLVAVAAGCTADNPDPNDPNHPDNNTPHALGNITLGETHAPSGGFANPIVGASFVPDAMAIKKCSTMVAGCVFTQSPKCGTGPASSCKIDEICKYDDSCTPRCTKPCTARCDDDEECYFPSPDSPSCRKKETFDAGAIAFAGTTTTLTLFPPYSYSAMGMGAPYLEKSEITVRATGATTAGFDAFEDKFTATTYLQTQPPINKLTKAQVFASAGPLNVKWAPGQDRVLITASGPMGSIVCTADDAAGSFDLPREAVTAAVGNDPDLGQSLALTVSRERKEVHKNHKTKGMLLTAKVQSDGWVELVTHSSESATFQGCNKGEALCSDMCIDVRYDEMNCGACGVKCAVATGDYCTSSKCVGPTACAQCSDNALKTVCKIEDATCRQNVSCGTLIDCIDACTTTSCENACYTAATPTAINLYNTREDCLRCTACKSECRSTGCFKK